MLRVNQLDCNVCTEYYRVLPLSTVLSRVLIELIDHYHLLHGSRVYDINTTRLALFSMSVIMDSLSCDGSGDGCTRLQEQKEDSNTQQRKDARGPCALLRDGSVRDQLDQKRHCNPSRYVKQKSYESNDGVPSSLLMKCAQRSNPAMFTGLGNGVRAGDQRRSGHQENAEEEDNGDELMCIESTTLGAFSQLHGNGVAHRECEIGSQSSQSVGRTAHVLTDLDLERLARAYKFRPPSDTHTFHSLGLGLFISETPNSQHPIKLSKLSKSYLSNVPVNAPCTYGCAFLIMIRVLMSHGCTLNRSVGLFESILSTHHQPIFDKLSEDQKRRRQHSVLGLLIHTTQFRMLSGFAFREKYNTIRREHPSHVRRAFSVTASISLWFGAMWVHEPNKCSTKALLDVLNECIFDMSATCDYGQFHTCEQLEFDSLKRAQHGLSHPTLQLYNYDEQFPLTLTLMRNLFWDHDSSVEDLIRNVVESVETDSPPKHSFIRLGSEIQKLTAKRKEPEWKQYEHKLVQKK